MNLPEEILIGIISYIEDPETILELLGTNSQIRRITKECIRKINTYKEVNSKLISLLPKIEEVKTVININELEELSNIAKLEHLKKATFRLSLEIKGGDVIAISEFMKQYCSGFYFKINGTLNKFVRNFNNAHFRFLLSNNSLLTIKNNIIIPYHYQLKHMLPILIKMNELSTVKALRLENYRKSEIKVFVHNYNMREVSDINRLEFTNIKDFKRWIPYLNILAIKEISLLIFDWYKVSDDFITLSSYSKQFFNALTFSRFPTITKIDIPINLNDLSTLFLIFPNVKSISLNADKPPLDLLSHTISQLQTQGYSLTLYTYNRYTQLQAKFRHLPLPIINLDISKLLSKRCLDALAF